MTRISDTTLPATFVDGEVLRGWQVNKIITVLKAGVNVNKNDIDKLLMGEASDFVFANKTLADEYLAENLSNDPAYPTADQYAIVMSGEANSDAIEIYQFNNDYTTVGAAWVLQSGEAFSIFEAYRIAKDYDNRMTVAETELNRIDYYIKNGLYAHKKLKYDTTLPSSTLNIGETRWNATERTLETKLTENVVARHSKDLFVYCQNKELFNLNAGTPVYISGSSGYGNIFYIKKADNDDYLKTSRCFGITSELITPDSYGFVCIKGIVGFLNTSSFTVGDVVYLGSAGTLTNVRPTKNVLALGVVLQKSASYGSIVVNSVFFPRPEDLSTVNFTGLANGDAIIKTANGWENRAVYTKIEADIKFVNATGDTMVGELAMDNNKITGLADGTNDQDAATIKNLDNHDESETAHLYIRELVQDLENEIARLDGRGKSYGEIPDTTAYLLSLDQVTRNGVITGAITASHGGLGYTPSNADLVYDVGVGDGVGYHEWEYNGENWVDNGMLGSGKASNDLFGYIKGDGTYLSVVSGLVQVLKSDYAAKLGTSGANYTYTDIYNALADRYTKSQTDALLDALKTAFGWEQTQTHSRTYTSADTFPYGTNVEIGDYSELSTFDYALISYVFDGEHITQLVRVDANILANGVLFKYENDGASNYIKLYMDAIKDYILLDTNYNLSPSGSHTLTVQIDGIKIKTFDASLVGYTNTTSGLTATNVQAAIDEIDGVIDDVLDGTTVVNKATNDANGDQIDSTYEKSANKVTEWSETPSDTNYPSEKLVDDRFKTVEPAILKNAEQDLRLATIEENLRKSMAGEVTGTANGTAIVSLGKDVANAPLKVEVDGGIIDSDNQLSLVSGTQDGLTITVSGNQITLNGTASGNTSIVLASGLTIGNKAYVNYDFISGTGALTLNDGTALHSTYNADYSGVVTLATASLTLEIASGQAFSSLIIKINVNKVTALISVKQYSPIYDTTFDLMSDAQIKAQMDYWVNAGVLPNNDIMSVGLNKRIRSVGKNLFDKGLPNYRSGGYYSIITGAWTNDLNYNALTAIQIKPSTAYIWSVSSNRNKIFLDINENFISSTASASFTPPSNAKYVVISRNIASDSLDTLQLEYGSTATTYEPYVSSDLFLQANAVGYKLPNGVADKIRYNNGAYVLDRYVQEYTLQASDIVELVTTNTNNDIVGINQNIFTDIINYNVSDAIATKIATNITFPRNNATADSLENVWRHYIAILTDTRRLAISVPKGTYASLAEARADLAGTKIWYQLATPIETEILSSGNLNGYQNGTVYVDDVMQDADIYGTNASVSNINYPIKTLERVVKINADGSQTNLAVSSATVASGGLSFTHTSLTSGDKVWFSYVYDVDGLFKSKTTVTFYDNKNVVSGSGTTAGKVYKIIPTVVDDNIVWTKVEV